jgi:hypothetical protein
LASTTDRKRLSWPEEAPACSEFRLIQPNSTESKFSTNVLHSSGVRLFFQN